MVDSRLFQSIGRTRELIMKTPWTFDHRHYRGGMAGRAVRRPPMETVEDTVEVSATVEKVDSHRLPSPGRSPARWRG
jgi:hypothetical protein